MQISLTGRACIIGSELPEIEKLYSRVPPRLGRFDDFTRLGFSAIGLALQEAGWTENTKWDDTGLVVSTEYGVMATDLAYYATTIEQDGLLSSPNLFSYTLPVTVIGECAVFFHLTGPTFCIGDDGRNGMMAIEIATLLLKANRAQRMIAAWIEAPPVLENSSLKQSCATAIVLESQMAGTV